MLISEYYTKTELKRKFKAWIAEGKLPPDFMEQYLSFPTYYRPGGYMAFGETWKHKYTEQGDYMISIRYTLKSRPNTKQTLYTLHFHRCGERDEVPEPKIT